MNFYLKKGFCLTCGMDYSEMKRSGELVKQAIAILLCALGMCAQTVTGEELVTNGSFEEYDGEITQQSGKYDILSDSLILTGWDKDISGGTIGLTTAADTSTWKNIARVKGEIACYFQKNCSLSQKINVSKAGVYWISFRYASRLAPNAYGKGRFYIEIDGVEIGHADCGTDVTFRTALMEATLSAGEHTLVVRHSNELSTDQEKRSNSVIDGISITPKTNLIFNGGFEQYMGEIPSVHHVTLDSSKNADGWSINCGLSEQGSPFLKYGNGSPYEGNTSLHFNGETAVTQTVYVATSGVYDITFAYAPRHTLYYYGGRIRTLLDGEEVGQYANCSGSTSDFRRHLIRTYISKGSHIFALKHTVENPADSSHVPCSVVDDVSIKEATALLLNGSFDYGNVDINSGGFSGATDSGYSNPGWTVTGNGGLARPGSPANAAMWISTSINVGIYAMFIQTGNYVYNNIDRQLPPVSISQSFDVPRAGRYAIRFSYASRPKAEYRGGVLYVRIYEGAGVEGKKIWEGSVTALSTTEFQHFVGEAKLREAAKYTLEFYAPQPDFITNGENQFCSVLDNVSIEYVGNIPGLTIVVQ